MRESLVLSGSKNSLSAEWRLNQDISYDCLPKQCNGLGAPLGIYLDNRWFLRLRFFTLAGGRILQVHWWSWGEGANQRRSPSYQCRSTILPDNKVTRERSNERMLGSVGAAVFPLFFSITPIFLRPFCSIYGTSTSTFNVQHFSRLGRFLWRCYGTVECSLSTLNFTRNSHFGF